MNKQVKDLCLLLLSAYEISGFSCILGLFLFSCVLSLCTHTTIFYLRSFISIDSFNVYIYIYIYLFYLFINLFILFLFFPETQSLVIVFNFALLLTGVTNLI